MKGPLNLWGILSSYGSNGQCLPVSARPIWPKPFSSIIFVRLKYLSPLWDSGRVWMLINPKIMSFWVQFGCRCYPEWVFCSLVSSFKVVFFALEVLLDCMDQLHCPLVQLGQVFLGFILILLSGLAGVTYLRGGGASLDLLSSEYSR